MKRAFWLTLKILPETCLIQEEFSEMWPKLYIDLDVKYPLFFSDFKKSLNYL